MAFFPDLPKDVLQPKFMQNMQETDCSILSYIIEETKVKQKEIQFSNEVYCFNEQEEYLNAVVC
jgi:hypothetical protein